MDKKKFFIGLGVVVIFILISLGIMFATSGSINNGESNNNDNGEEVLTSGNFGIGLIVSDTKDSNLLVKNVYEALDGVKVDMGTDFNYEEGVDFSSLDERIKASIDSGSTIIYLIGGDYADSISSIAVNYPDINFVLVNSNLPEKGENLISLEVNYRGSGFAKGVLAGLITNNNVVSSVGLKEEPVVIDEMYGFEKGVEDISLDISVYGNFVESDSINPDITSLIEEFLTFGVDVFFPMALDENITALDTLRSNGVDTIVNDEEILKSFEDIVVAAIYTDVKGELLKVSLKAKDGELFGSDNIILPIKVTYGDIDTDVVDEVNSYISKINSGELDMNTLVPME